MPEVRLSPSKLNDSPAIIVTSLRPRERPQSVRQRRIAQFCRVEADRKCRKRWRSRCKRIINRVVSVDTPFRANPYLVMEQHEKEVPLDDVKVLFPARDLLYSDSEVAIRSSRSTGCVPIDPPPSIRSAGSSEYLKVPPRPCSRVGRNDGTGVGDRYLNKPSEGVASRDEVDRKPYRQVWHNLWEHQVAEPVGPSEQVTSYVKNPPSVEKQQRRGLFSSGWTFRSKIMNRPWRRPGQQRTPSTGLRSAQRKPSAMKDEGDSESLLERVPKMRRREPPRRKQGVPRVVVTTASRPMTAISTEELDVSPSVHPRSAPANSKPPNSDRMARFSTVKPLGKPRFSVPIKASRVPMDVYFKEMSCPKPHYSRKDLSAPVKCRGLHRGVEMPFHDLSQDTAFFRDAGSNLPERSHVATLRSGRRMFNRPTLEATDSNPYPNSFQADAECIPIPKNLLPADSPLQLSKSRTALRPPYTDGSMELGPHGKLSCANVSVLNHFYGRPVASRETSVKSPLRYTYTEADGRIHPGPRFPVPALYQNDLPVTSHYLHDSHATPSQTTQTYHFSRNAPDVLISPPPNPRHRGDTLRVPGAALEIEPSPITVCNSHCIPTINFIPRYFSFRPHEATIEDRNLPEPFLQQNITPRAFMPSVDFSRTGSPPRPHPDIFPYVRATGFENFVSSHAGRVPFPTNFHQAGVHVPFRHDENTLKPSKMLLTFGAQVPSSERVPLSSLTCGYLSSPSVDTEASFSGQQDQLKPKSSPYAPPVLPVHLTKRQEEIKLKTDSITASTKVEQATGGDAGSRVRNPDKPSLFVDTPIDKGKEDSVSKLEEKVDIPTESLNPTKEVNDHSQPIKSSAFLLDCISREIPEVSESSTSLFGLARTRSLHLCSCTHSDTKLSTVTEKSSDTKQSVESPLPEVTDLSRPPAAVAPRISQPEQELRFQLVESKMVEEPKEERNGPLTLMRSKRFELVEDPPGTQSRGKSLDMLEGEVSITEICDDNSSALNDTPSEHFRPLSDFRTSCESTMYRVSTGYRYTNGKTSFTESAATCLDDSRVSSLLQSVNSADVRQRFQCAVSDLGARRHIGLQCQLEEKPTENAFPDCKSKQTITHDPQPVGRKDACVQVPVSCCQSVETERYTTEKGVPECRAGLTLRLKSTVVDVPPVVKVTETVGISTEGMTYEEASQAIQDCESKGKVERTCPTSSGNCADCRRPLNISTSPKRLKRLKPFFRSHCDEFANICALAAVPLRAENGQIHPTLRSDSSANKGKQRGSCEEDLQDRRRNFRSAREDTGLPTNASCNRKDDYYELNRAVGIHKIDPGIANDHPRNQKSSSRRTADVPDRKHPRNTGREDRAGCRRKVGEPSKVTRPSTGNSDYENTKRKPGCAVCRKEHSHSSQKEAVMTARKADTNTPDIRCSLVHFGLSSIITSVEKIDSPKAEQKLASTSDSYDDFQRQSRSEEDSLEYLPFESSKSGRSGVEDDICAHFGRSSVVLVSDTLAFNQSRKDSSGEPVGSTDSGQSPHVQKSKRMSVTSRSTVPAIYLTRAESNDVPGAEEASIFAPPMQFGFTSVESTTKDFSVNSKLKGALNKPPLKESNHAVDVSGKQPALPFVEPCSKKSTGTSAAKTSKTPEDTVDTASSVEVVEQVETGSAEEPDEDSGNPADRGVDKQTSAPKLDETVSAENESFDSVFSPEPSIGCVFTAMRRYMKSHQRPERTSEPAYWNKCPGFRFTGVPANQTDSVRKRGYRDCCKCARTDLDSTSGTHAEVSSFRTQRCTRGPGSSQKHDLEEEVKVSSVQDKRNVTLPNTKSLWQSVFQKSTTERAADLVDAKFTPKDSRKTLQDIVSSLKYAKGVCWCESPEKSEESVEEPIAIRTLPPEVDVAEDLRSTYPRCASALPDSSSGARRRSSSAPGEVRIRHSRCWSSDHSSLRRYLRDLPRIPTDTHHRIPKHRISWMDDEAVVEDDRGEDKQNVSCYRWNHS